MPSTVKDLEIRSGDETESLQSSRGGKTPEIQNKKGDLLLIRVDRKGFSGKYET